MKEGWRLTITKRVKAINTKVFKGLSCPSVQIIDNQERRRVRTNGCVKVSYRRSRGNIDIITSLSAHRRSCTALLLLFRLGTGMRSKHTTKGECEGKGGMCIERGGRTLFDILGYGRVLIWVVSRTM
jgi:hypothetical protein